MLLCVHENMCQVDTQTQLSGCVYHVCDAGPSVLHIFYVHMRNQGKDINIPLTPCYDLNYVTFIVLLPARVLIFYAGANLP